MIDHRKEEEYPQRKPKCYGKRIDVAFKDGWQNDDGSAPELEKGIAQRNLSFAVAALATEKEIADDGNQISVLDLRLASGTLRTPSDVFAFGNTGNEDRPEATERQTEQ